MKPVMPRERPSSPTERNNKDDELFSSLLDETALAWADEDDVKGPVSEDNAFVARLHELEARVAVLETAVTASLGGIDRKRKRQCVEDGVEQTTSGLEEPCEVDPQQRGGWLARVFFLRWFRWRAHVEAPPV